ncbi:unnamed protein product, partial [Callosobruchus maculatus]
AKGVSDLYKVADFILFILFLSQT